MLTKICKTAYFCVTRIVLQEGSHGEERGGHFPHDGVPHCQVVFVCTESLNRFLVACHRLNHADTRVSACIYRLNFLLHEAVLNL